MNTLQFEQRFCSVYDEINLLLQSEDSVILLEQLRTIDKKRLKDKICHLHGDIMKRVNQALKVSLELDT